MPKDLFMKHNCLFLIILLFAVFIGCDSQKDNSLMAVSNIWDCTRVDNSSALNITDIFPRAETIELEDTEESTVGRINKLIAQDSLLFVLDKNLAKKIFIFNSETGKFIRSIGTIGSGSDEYVILNDASFDESSSLLKVLCNNNKIFTYNTNGELLHTQELPFRAVNMEIFDGRYYFFSDSQDASEVIVTDNSLKELRSYFPNKDNPIIHMLVHPFSKNPSEGICYMRYMDNNIYQIHGADSISIKYQIDFGDNAYLRSMAENDGEEVIKQKLKHYRGRLKYFVENDSAAIIIFFEKGEPCMSIFNRKDHTSHTAPVANITENRFGTLISPIEYSSKNGFYEVIEFLPEQIPDTVFKHSGENPIIHVIRK